MWSSRWVLAQVVGLRVLGAQDIPTQAAQTQAAQAQAPDRPSAQRGPFEAIPEPRSAPPQKRSGPRIQAMEFRGTARVHLSALRAVISTRVGDAYDLGALRNDAEALRETQRFSQVKWEAEPSPEGVIVRFVLIDRPLIESIECRGDTSVTLAEILERFRERKLKLRVESLLDENELPRAAATVRELVGEKGRPKVVVTPMVERTGAPSIAKITFTVAESQ